MFVLFWLEDSMSSRNCGSSVLLYMAGIDSSFKFRFKFLIFDNILFIFLYFSADLAEMEPRTFNPIEIKEEKKILNNFFQQTQTLTKISTYMRNSSEHFFAIKKQFVSFSEARST